MKEERSAIMNQVYPQMEKLASERNVRFSIVDLQWGITEKVKYHFSKFNLFFLHLPHYTIFLMNFSLFPTIF